MTRMSTLYSRLSYGSGTGLIGLGASARAYAQATKESVWLLADKMAGALLNNRESCCFAMLTLAENACHSRFAVFLCEITS